jgi:transposase-like protein
MRDPFDELKDWLERELDYINKQLAPALIAQGKILCPRYHADTEQYYTNSAIYNCNVCQREFKVKDGKATGWHY